MYDTIDEAAARFEAARRRGEAFAAEVLEAARVARFDADLVAAQDAMAERAAGWSA